MKAYVYKCYHEDCLDREIRYPDEPKKFFVTWFPPLFEDPAYCPNCGKEDLVEFIEEREIDPL